MISAKVGNLPSPRRAGRFAAAFLGAAVFLGLGVVQAGPAHAIANGQPVPEGSYRFSVKLTMTGIPTASGGRRNSACSGALIHPSWVITAGHCFRDINGVRVERPVADLTTATVGRADLSGTNGHVATVVAVRQSPTNDIALVRLDTPITDIQPLRYVRTTPQVGQVLRITGYGADNSENPQPSTILRTGQVKVASVATSTLGVTGYAPAPDTSACPYDSGAPYFAESKGKRPVLVSVESTGPNCPHADVETTSRVDTIVPWIKSAIGG
ncbi:trypsin-like serine protease [Micromonospora sp. KC213]|uniref:S1 family peptidase n=1 Tax=Micromonospora sp. KC213 TaxID=2530378 RepID=UPI001049C818|nr:trypsin-like serine protease [Micromonospora sp. KC213]TDC40018.1 trypsin-like serine protease [Micromonospora sp. KC213]